MPVEIDAIIELRRARAQVLRDSAPETWRLDGRVALITGAQRGIGFACAEALSRAGAGVACVDRPGSELELAVDRLNAAASAHFADLADVLGMERLVGEVEERHGRLDILVHAAGMLAPAGGQTIV